MTGDELLVVTPTFHPEPIGTPHYVTDMVEELSGKARRVRVVTNQPFYPAFRRYPGYGRATREDRLGDVPVHRLPTLVPVRGSRLGRVVSELNLLAQVWWARATGRLRRRHHVIAVSPGSPMTIAAAATMRRRDGRLLVVVHDVGFGLAEATSRGAGRWLARAARAAELRALDKADVIVTLSEGMRRQLRSAGVTPPIEVVPLWPTVEPPEGRIEPQVDVLYSGALGRKQGLDDLLDAALVLQDLSPGTRVAIRGDGSEALRLRRRAAAMRLHNVEFQDLVPRQELGRTLAEAAVHVIPQLPQSADSAVPSKLYNILAVGRPVVVAASRDTLLGELADDCAAVIAVPPGDADAMAHTLADLLADAERRSRLGRAGKEWIAVHASRRSCVDRYLDLLGA